MRGIEAVVEAARVETPPQAAPSTRTASAAIVALNAELTIPRCFCYAGCGPGHSRHDAVARVAKLSPMDSQTARERLDQWYRALNAQQFQELAALLGEIADSDVVVEYPQSGERIKGKENNLAVLKNYPGLPNATVEDLHGAEDKWVLTPSWTPLRITGTGDRYVVEGRLVYPNGEEWKFIDVMELRNDKVIKVTEYFAAPFPAAEWRAKWVEKVESPGR